MSDKAEKKKEEPAAGHADSKKKGGGIIGLLTKVPVMIGGAMFVEALFFVAVLYISKGPAKANAGVDLPPASEKSSEGGHEGAEGAPGAAAPVDPKKVVEIPIVDIKAPNKRSGRTIFYDVSVKATATQAHAADVAATIKDREALITDRIRTIIAQSDPDKLGGGSEPGLETLKRQIKGQLDEIVGDGIIDDVLVPRCNPFMPGF